MPFNITRFCMLAVVTVLAWKMGFGINTAAATGVAFKQAVAEAAAGDPDIAAFYKSNGYESIWTGRSRRERQRRVALFKALTQSGNHGLPSARYDATGLQAKMRAAKDPRTRGLVEVDLSRSFLQYARDVQTGVLVPGRIDSAIVRQVPYRDRTSYLVSFTKSNPSGFFKALSPDTMEYTALMNEKLRLERLLAKGGWGPRVSAKVLKSGQSGAAVVELRNRLIAKGFLKRSNIRSYDENIQAAVQKFQLTHGLTTDGVAGPSTMTELNRSVQFRLQSIIVAMERERWINRDRGERHILVNIPDFTAKVVDNGKVTFSTRSVVGAKSEDRPTPEFSDVMEFMVVNPSWYVPRSIVTKEYLPELQSDPNAVNHIEITDTDGRVIDRTEVNFADYTTDTFPFAMRQPPSRGNALGLVKFMFPNRHNIYLHDTPAKNLFGREVRAYSHGCVRLADPFDFAYALLALQTSEPKGYFQSVLATGEETQVDLATPVPVHIVYRTAFSTPKGHTHFRRDIYGRDGRIWTALSKAGVALRAVQG